MEVRGLTLKGEILMMKAIKNFMNKPWTWGTYFKFCGVAMSFPSDISFRRIRT